MEAVKQEFSGPVGDVAGRDIINNNYSHGRPLTKAERSELNKLVQQLENEYGELGWQTWKFLHRTIGVENIETMCLDHRSQAETILGLLLDRAKAEKAHAQLQQDYDQIAESLDIQDEDVKQLTVQVETLTRSNAAMQRLHQSATKTTARDKEVNELAEKLYQANRSCSDMQRRYELSRASLEESQSRYAAAVGSAISFRKRWLWSWGAIGVLTCLMVTLSYQTYKLRNTLRATEARLSVCEFEGKTYGVGSSVSGDAAAALKCVLGERGTPEWQAAGKPRNRAKT
ncbi:hypothetical protein HF909_10345 [Ralstonia pseudosolanacearum]|uniref:Uncharacterized protein n=1 Tax=Ralstonia solanacearum TaxID=305 RepID=A0AA92QBC0_RALSL|nr:hypothetical protein [Ralstonia pseudosolanacearum]QOK96793.1 hypothetical protein HF909_10345 [Ralstonia pseudosolanacearum]